VTAEIEGARARPLEDLMVAMDVVDTVRHREHLVDRELNAETRRARLIERLRQIYTAQGIEVTDAALEAGVDALEQERFAYSPPDGGISVALARVYVHRGRWLRPLLLLLGLGLAIGLAWLYFVKLPEQRTHSELPQQVEAAYTRAVSVSKSDVATQQAAALQSEARAAIENEDFAAATRGVADLESLAAELERSYEIRIVSRPNELSGVWRVPDVNPNARNYYLIVEAVDARGNIVPRQVRNEEGGRLQQVTKWGIRVDEETFESVAADKRDDGIIQDYVVGRKEAGRIEPEYRIPTSGGTITEW
jgi:hypothetical protein